MDGLVLACCLWLPTNYRKAVVQIKMMWKRRLEKVTTLAAQVLVQTVYRAVESCFGFSQLNRGTFQRAGPLSLSFVSPFVSFTCRFPWLLTELPLLFLSVSISFWCSRICSHSYAPFASWKEQLSYRCETSHLGCRICHSV